MLNPNFGQPRSLCCTHTNRLGISYTRTRALQRDQEPLALPGEPCHVVIWLKTPLHREKFELQSSSRCPAVAGGTRPRLDGLGRLGLLSCIPLVVVPCQAVSCLAEIWLYICFRDLLCWISLRQETPRSSFLPKELKIAHPLPEHPLLRGQAVGSCVYCTFRSPFSFDLHLVSRANPEKCCVSSSLADVCDFI